MLKHFEQIWGDDLKKAAITQVRALAKFDPVQTLRNSVDTALAINEQEAQMIEYMEKMGKKPKAK